MSALTEFLCVALALYLWESTLWLPLRAVGLRRRCFGKGWKVLDPRDWIAMRETGMLALLPLPPDRGLAACQAPPLLVTDDGVFFMETAAGQFHRLGPLTWDDVKQEEHDLVVRGARTRISSSRCIEVLRRAKNRGVSPEAAVRQAWRLAVSPVRAGREWRRWRLVAGPLRWYGPVLVVGGFVALPMAYVHADTLQTLWVALWLWALMACTAAHLWWLGKRVYPGARSALRMDAVLSLVVPFHAMRAFEIASVHAMGTTHPAGLIMWANDLENPWLGRFVRRLLFPLGNNAGDLALSNAAGPIIAESLSKCGSALRNFDTTPDRSQDPDAASYCPRCHGRFLTGVIGCPDCRGIALREFQMGD